MRMEPERSRQPEWGRLIAHLVLLLVIAFAVLSLVKVEDEGPVLEREVVFVEFGPQTGYHNFTITYAVNGDIWTRGVHSKDAYIRLDPSAQGVQLVIRDIPMRNLLGTWRGGKTEIVMTVPDWDVNLGTPRWREEFRGNRYG